MNMPDLSIEMPDPNSTDRVLVQVVQHLRPGGIETMALDLLEQSHLPCYVISLEGEKADALSRWPRLQRWARRLIFLNKPTGRSPVTLLKLCYYLRRLNTGAVHTHHIGPLLYGGIAARLCGIPCRTHTEHDAWHLADEHALRLQRWLLNRVKPQLVADCEAVAQQLQNVLPGYAVKVILNGVNTDRFSPVDSTGQQLCRLQLGLPSNVQLIGCAARLEPVKAIENLLIAMVGLSDSVHLALAGDGSQRANLEQFCREFKLSSRVHFLGALDAMPAFYRSLDLFCLPSLKEGLPLSPLEAQACNVPVVLTRVGGCADITCAESGQLVAASDCSGLRQALFQGLNLPVATAPRDFILRTADLQNTARCYEALLLQPKESCHAGH